MPKNNNFKQRIKTTIYISSYRDNIMMQELKSSYSVTSIKYKGMEVKFTAQEK